MNTHDKYELPPLPNLIPVDHAGKQQAMMDYARAAIEADRQSRGEPVAEVPEGWREQFKEAVYDNLAAADNQDVPLEEYPDRILGVLNSIVGPRHPTVVLWRNDAIKMCMSIAYKYCRDPETYKYLKQDFEALITEAPQPTAPVNVPSNADPIHCEPGRNTHKERK